MTSLTTENWRLLLYFPMGIAPSLFFSSRFLIQWVQSERHKRSGISPLFWQLSLMGNFLLMLHYSIQMQYPFALIQTAGGVIAWRNLNLLRHKTPYTTRAAIGIMLAALAIVTGIFSVQSIALGQWNWVRSPITSFSGLNTSLSWHLLGALSGALFASRFWVQWWQVERGGPFELSPIFWWLSIIGTLFSLIYFVHIHDIVSIFNQSFVLIPSIRNLILLRRAN